MTTWPAVIEGDRTMPPGYRRPEVSAHVPDRPDRDWVDGWLHRSHVEYRRSR